MNKGPDNGMVGVIPNSGAAVVPAAHQVKQPAKDKVKTGKDLRAGK